MYKVGDKLECIFSISGNFNFTAGKIYEIARQKIETKSFIMFDDYSVSTEFVKAELDFGFCKPEILNNTETKFRKDDSLKVKVSLVEADFILGIAQVATFGANKYEKDNWKKCEDLDRYKDAALRHLFEYLKGNTKDEETGLSHLYHASCNLMFLDYFDRKETIKMEDL